MLEGPHTWIAMLKWIENYGYQRQTDEANKGTALYPLDYEKFKAPGRPDDYAGCTDLKNAMNLFAANDMGPAFQNLFQTFQLCSPRLSQISTKSGDWRIESRVSANQRNQPVQLLTTPKESPLRSLKIQPTTKMDSIDPAANLHSIGIYAFEKKIETFIFSSERSICIWNNYRLQRLLYSIWEYGNKRIHARLKYEGQLAALVFEPMPSCIDLKNSAAS